MKLSETNIEWEKDFFGDIEVGGDSPLSGGFREDGRFWLSFEIYGEADGFSEEDPNITVLKAMPALWMYSEEEYLKAGGLLSPQPVITDVRSRLGLFRFHRRGVGFEVYHREFGSTLATLVLPQQHPVTLILQSRSAMCTGAPGKLSRFGGPVFYGKGIRHAEEKFLEWRRNQRRLLEALELDLRDVESI